MADSQRIDTKIHDLPTWMSDEVIEPVNNPSSVQTSVQISIKLTPTISDRRIFLLQVKPSMPGRYRLCWICCKYTRVKLYRWHETRYVHTMGNNAINIARLSEKPLEKVHAHHQCLVNHYHITNFYGLPITRRTYSLTEWCFRHWGTVGDRYLVFPTVSVPVANGEDSMTQSYPTVDGQFWIHENLN